MPVTCIAVLVFRQTLLCGGSRFGDRKMVSVESVVLEAIMAGLLTRELRGLERRYELYSDESGREVNH